MAAEGMNVLLPSSSPDKMSEAEGAADSNTVNTCEVDAELRSLKAVMVTL